MRIFFLAAFSLWMLSVNCNKESGNTICKSDLIITKVQTPRTGMINAGVTSAIESYGPDLCYSFSHVEVTGKSALVYEIRVKANYTCGKTVCAQAIIQANPTIKINTTVPGTYVLKFYNVNSLFQSDTVQVN